MKAKKGMKHLVKEKMKVDGKKEHGMKKDAHKKEHHKKK